MPPGCPPGVRPDGKAHRGHFPSGWRRLPVLRPRRAAPEGRVLLAPAHRRRRSEGHETRLRAMERRMWRVSGMAAIGVSGVSYVVDKVLS